MKREPYKNQQRWDNFKDAHFNNIPKGIRKEDWKLLIEFLKDMELGLNTPKGRKGKRDVGTLLNLSSHNKLFLENFNKPLLKLTKQDLHKLEKDVEAGKILKRNGQKYQAFGNYIKDFQVFWGWLLRTGKVNENICEDISCKTDKPSWVYIPEKKIKDFFNVLIFTYRVICWFFYDSGVRVTEGLNVRVRDFSKDYKQVVISDETAKTFGRTINLKLSSELIKKYIEVNNLQPDDFLIQKHPFAINKYLRENCAKMFGGENISNPKSKGKYKEFTLYDIRHNSSCFWLNRYPTHKGLMYRFGWKRADKIEYYSAFLGQADELTDSDMILGEDRDKIYKLESKIENMKLQNDAWKTWALEIEKRIKAGEETTKKIEVVKNKIIKKQRG